MGGSGGWGGEQDFHARVADECPPGPGWEGKGRRHWPGGGQARWGGGYLSLFKKTAQVHLLGGHSAPPWTPYCQMGPLLRFCLAFCFLQSCPGWVSVDLGLPARFCQQGSPEGAGNGPGWAQGSRGLPLASRNQQPQHTVPFAPAAAAGAGSQRSSPLQTQPGCARRSTSSCRGSLSQGPRSTDPLLGASRFGEPPMGPLLPPAPGVGAPSCPHSPPVPVSSVSPANAGLTGPGY